MTPLGGGSFVNGTKNRNQKFREGTKVGFFGCSGRLVRCRVDSDRPPHTITVECPACERQHVVQITWRAWADGDDASNIEIEIGAGDA
jgi:hypothetical protein